MSFNSLTEAFYVERDWSFRESVLSPEQKLI